ncbi:MAG: hypothetical protein ABI051_12205 [Vicinamibacterales bacterium]
MRQQITGLALVLTVSGVGRAQEAKPVPRDSVRLFVPGCAKGYMFTVAPRTVDQPGSSSVPEGTHLRMNGPKKMMAEIKTHESSMIEVTGLVKKDQIGQGGVKVGPVRITPGLSSPGSGSIPSPGSGQVSMDVEGWRSVAGTCPSR